MTFRDRVPPPRRPDTFDRVMTGLLMVVFAGVTGLGFVWSLFAMMATDRCGPGSGYACSDALVLVAYAVAWGGLALAVALTLKGIRHAAAAHRPGTIWPCVGLVIDIAALAAGGMLLDIATGG
jgi:hypothetical protein